MDTLYSWFTLYFVHIFWGMAGFVYVYNLYFHFFKVKRRDQYISDEVLMNRYFLATRKGIIK